MKSAILGLRKRETYDELINEISDDPIGKIQTEEQPKWRIVIIYLN